MVMSKKYKTIVIDPPWRLSSAGNVMSGDIGDTLPYHTMTNKEIMDFPINDFVDSTGCTIFVWTVQSRIRFTFELLEKWGFKHQHLFTWHKNGGLTIHGIHLNAEYIMYGYVGSRDDVIRFHGTAVPSCFSAKRTKHHSQKPAEFYEMIRPKTQEPRIDIFARRRHEGYDAWGDQVEPELQTTIQEALV